MSLNINTMKVTITVVNNDGGNLNFITLLKSNELLRLFHVDLK